MDCLARQKRRVITMDELDGLEFLLGAGWIRACVYAATKPDTTDDDRKYGHFKPTDKQSEEKLKNQSKFLLTCFLADKMPTPSEIWADDQRSGKLDEYTEKAERLILFKPYFEILFHILREAQYDETTLMHFFMYLMRNEHSRRKHPYPVEISSFENIMGRNVYTVCGTPPHPIRVLLQQARVARKRDKRGKNWQLFFQFGEWIFVENMLLRMLFGYYYGSMP